MTGIPNGLATYGLTKTFGGLVAVDSLDLTVETSEIHGLIGPNGSGKTTTVNLITGLYTPTRGAIYAAGHDVTRTPARLRTNLGLARTFQNIRLFRRLSVLDNVLVGQYCRTRSGLLGALLRGSSHRREEAAARAKALQALDVVGLQHRSADRPGDLPYGQQRLVEIARALATEPRTLLLDEPAAGMNPTEKQELLGLIRRLNQEKKLTILLIEHDMNMVMNACHRITVLNFGACIATGSAAAVRQNPAVIEAYLGRGGGSHAHGA